MLQGSKVDSTSKRFQIASSPTPNVESRTEPEFVFKCCQEETEDKYDEKLYTWKTQCENSSYICNSRHCWNDMDHNTPLSGSRRLDSRSSTWWKPKCGFCAAKQQNMTSWFVYSNIFLEGRNHRKSDLWLTVSIANKQSFCIMIFVHSNCLINESGSLTWCGFTSTPPFTFSLLWAFTFSRTAWPNGRLFQHRMSVFHPWNFRTKFSPT